MDPNNAFAFDLFTRMPERLKDFLTWFSNGLPELVIGARLQNSSLGVPKEIVNGAH